MGAFPLRNATRNARSRSQTVFLMFCVRVRSHGSLCAQVNRDRFVLSNGHACALLYNMLNLCGYPQFTLEQLKKFRTVGSM